MVVPMENITSSKSKSKKYIGNGLVVHVKENNSRVTLIGNDCTIRIDNNNGILKVIGNACNIRVLTGSGGISYNGNEGCIRVGPTVDLDKVTYLGNEGRIFRESRVSKHTKEPKTEEVSLEKCRRSAPSLNIINESHKQFSLSESVCSLAIPGILAVPHVSECVIKIRKNKQKS